MLDHRRESDENKMNYDPAVDHHRRGRNDHFNDAGAATRLPKNLYSPSNRHGGYDHDQMYDRAIDEPMTISPRQNRDIDHRTY